jgi:CLIP-associating protein 1/2
MTEKILRQSREAESALADALEYSRKRSTGSAADVLDTSDKSETSSLCSEKSFDYGRRNNNACDGISDIIANCASTHWADRKDGLVGLQSYFREGRLLSATELRRVTEIFTKMFMDAHTKVKFYHWYRVKILGETK